MAGQYSVLAVGITFLLISIGLIAAGVTLILVPEFRRRKAKKDDEQNGPDHEYDNEYDYDAEINENYCYVDDYQYDDAPYNEARSKKKEVAIVPP